MKQHYRNAKQKLVNGAVGIIFASTLIAGEVAPILAQSVMTEPTTVVQVQQTSCQPSTALPKTLFLPFVAGGNMGATGNQATTATLRQLRYESNKTYTYEWKMNIQSASASRDTTGVNTQGEQTNNIEALADVTILQQNADGSFTGQITLRDPLLCSDNGDGTVNTAEDPALTKALQQPLRFTQSAQGAITAVAFPTDAPTMAINLQKGVLNALQLALKEGEESYVVEEEGAQGSYNVQYSLQEAADGLAITKRFTQDSFRELVSSSNVQADLRLQTAVDMLLDRASGVVTAVNVAETIQTSNESLNSTSGEGAVNGVIVWSTVKTANTLVLQSVSEANTLVAAQTDVTYQAGNLRATLETATANTAAVDITKVDLSVEFDLLEREPQNPAAVSRIIDLLAADPDQQVLAQIEQGLAQHATNDKVAAAYIDVLIGSGTPAAQSIINQVLSNSDVQASKHLATYSLATQEHALIGTVLLQSPTPSLVNTLQALSNNSASPLREQAVMALGAAAYNVADEDPTIAAAINAELSNNLQSATASEQVELYLHALGNAGNPAALDVIDDYLADTLTVGQQAITDTMTVQLAALGALRKIPGSQVDQLLASALAQTPDDNAHTATRQFIAAILAGRNDNRGVAALPVVSAEAQAPTLLGGRYERSWNYHFGGNYVGVYLPGKIIVASPPAYLMDLYAIQEVNAHVWQYNPNLLRAEVWSRREPTQRRVGVYLSLANNLVRRQYEATMQCTHQAAGTLYEGVLNIFDVSVRIPIYGALTVNFGIKGNGFFALIYNYRHNNCDVNARQIVATITPRAGARATATAYVTIVALRGGGTLEADLLNASVPAYGSMFHNASTNQLQLCLNVKAQAQVLNGRFYIWADAWFFGWRRVVSKTLWTFQTPTGTYQFVAACW